MPSKVLVVGSGCIGLRTALELLRVGHKVVLKSAYHPLNTKTCSMGAAGLWMPYKCEDPRIDKMAIETLDELFNLSRSRKNLVEIVPTLYLTNSHKGPTVEDFKNFEAKDYFAEGGNSKSPFPEWTKDRRLNFQHLTIEMIEWQNQVLKLKIPSVETMKQSGYTHAWLFNPPIVDAPKMLMDMLKEIQSHPLVAKVNVDMNGGYQSMNEIVRDAHDNGCDAVVNCTGMGSANVFNDKKLIAGRGILLNYDRNCARVIGDGNMVNDAAILTEDPPWGSVTEPAYVIPRGDIFVVGGAYHENSTAEKLSENERERLTENANLLGMINTSVASPVDEWVGFRPVRRTVRMGIDKDLSKESQLRIFHCYGQGGSGWTTFVGAAKQVANLVSSSER